MKRRIKPWHAIAAILPAGLLMGLVAGQATRPVMKMQDDRPWPQSVDDRAIALEPWRPVYEAGPEDLSPYAHSYRPDLDYSAFAWPDQDEVDIEYFAGDYGETEPFEAADDPPMPQVHRARSELAATRAAAAAQDAREVAAADDAGSAPPTLPAVPPDKAAPAFAAVEAIVTESF